VFISFSHEDEALLTEFKTHLVPYERTFVLDAWSDERIRAGEVGDDVIQEAMADACVAVCLVSRAFLASGYIREHELPYLTQARRDGKLELTALYLGASGIGDPRVGLAHELLQYQGLNQPEEYVEAAAGNARKDILTRAARELADLVARRSAPGRPRVERDLPELWIRYTKAGASWVAKLSHDGQELRLPQRTFDFAPLLREWAHDGPALLEGTAFSDRLGAALLGTDERELQDVLRALHRLPAAQPVAPARNPVRVRLALADAALAGLPWTRASHGGRRLGDDGWRVELVPPAGAGERTVDLRLPCPLLALVPPSPHESAHVRYLREIVHDAMPTFPDGLCVVRDLPEFEHKVWRVRPSIVVYFGPAERHDDELRLPLGAGGVPLAALREAWREHAPKVVCATVFTERRLDLGASFGELAGDVPVVVSQAWWHDAAPALASAQRFVKGLLDGAEPAPLAYEAGLGTVAVWSTARHFRTHRTQPIKQALTDLLLDRRAQKNEAVGAVDELLQQDGRRVCALVAHGDAGNLTERFGAAVYEHLTRTRDEQLAPKRIPVEWHDLREATAAEIESRLQFGLGLDPRQRLVDGLRAKLPRVSGKRPMLHLDFAVVRDSDDKLLPAWVEFCRERLAAQCPPALRVLATFVAELPGDRHPAFQARVKDLRRTLGFANSAFRLEAVAPLGQVDDADLSDYLTRPGFSSCPDKLVAEVAELVVARTGGHFEQVVALLREAEETTYLAVLDRLRAETA
jgi:hypothetical protein